MNKKEVVLLLFLLCVSLLSRFYNLTYPPKVVFDEAHFGLYATKYLGRQYYFDIHPPFGKLILGLVAFLFRVQPGFQFPPGENYGEFKFLPLRAFIAFLGSLLIILIYLWVKALGFSEKTAFFASFLLLLDNGLLIQSRLILLDVILLFFIFLSLYFLTLSKKFLPLSREWLSLNLLSGLSCGMAISTKLTAFALFPIFIIDLILENEWLKNQKCIIAKICLNFLLPIFCYFLFFFIHFKLAIFPCNVNCGKVLDSYLEQNLSRTFEKNIGQASHSYFSNFYNFFISPPPGNFLEKWISTQIVALIGNIISSESHYYSSDWYSFPFMIRPVAYFLEKSDRKIAQIWFLGNPLVWWFSLLGLIIYLYLSIKIFLFKANFKISPIFSSKNFIILVWGYFLFFFPLSIVKRFVLPYHYLPPLIFSVIISSALFNEILDVYFVGKFRKVVFFIFLSMIFFSFLFFSPFTYGFFLTPQQIKIRLWLPTWEFWVEI